MSCGDVNWVVPGANPCNQIPSGGGVTVVNAGTGITVSGKPESPIINAISQIQTLGDTASNVINLPSLTVTEIFRLTFNTASSGFIIVNGNATIKSTVNPQHNILYYCEIDGTMFQSAVNYDSISGSDHFTTIFLSCSGNLAPGNHTAIFYVITDAGANELQASSRNMNAIINLM